MLNLTVCYWRDDWALIEDGTGLHWGTSASWNYLLRGVIFMCPWDVGELFKFHALGMTSENTNQHFPVFINIANILLRVFLLCLLPPRSSPLPFFPFFPEGKVPHLTADLTADLLFSVLSCSSSMLSPNYPPPYVSRSSCFFFVLWVPAKGLSIYSVCILSW